MALTRDSVIGKKHPTPVKALDVPGWGDCFVRKLSAAEVEQCESMKRENDFKPTNVMARFAAMCVSDADGNRIFQDADAEEIGREAWNVDAIMVVWNEGLAFNKMRVEDREEAKKNSDGTNAG